MIFLFLLLLLKMYGGYEKVSFGSIIILWLWMCLYYFFIAFVVVGIDSIIILMLQRYVSDDVLLYSMIIIGFISWIIITLIPFYLTINRNLTRICRVK
jgi:hypothetical protein